MIDNDFKVADMSLADFGRYVLPKWCQALWLLTELSDEKPLQGADRWFSSYDSSDSCLIETLVELGADAMGLL